MTSPASSDLSDNSKSRFDSTSCSSIGATLANIFSSCLFNAGSVCPDEKTDKVSDFIHELGLDLVFLTETWFKDGRHDAKIKQLTPPGYKLRSFPRPTRGGGIAVLYKDILDASLVFSTSFPFPTTSFEAVEIVFTSCGQSMIFVCIYRPPPSQTNKFKSSTFLDEFQTLAEHYHFRNGKLTILGDINVHFDDKESSTTKRMCSILSDFSLSQLVSQTTHKYGHILDWLIVRDSDNLVNHVSVTDRIKSDHFPIVFSLDISKPTRLKKSVVRRKLTSIDPTVFASEASSRLSDRPEKADKLSHYNTTLQQLLDEHAPPSTRLVPDRPFSPWYGQDILKAKRLRRRAERLKNKTKLTAHRQIYEKEIKKVNRLVSRKKNAYFSSTVLNAKNSKDLFSVMNGLLGTHTNSPLPSTHDPSELPNAFSVFFTSKVQNLRKKLDETPVQQRYSDATFTGAPFEAFSPVSQSDVEKTIREMTLKSCEIDPIPASVLEKCLPQLLPFITDIINTSLTTGVFPADLKKAIVRPLLKKHNLDPNNLSNYRPVSNIPFMSKLIEKVVLLQLNDHLISNELYDTFQSAYRANRSTETALLRILHDLLIATDSGQVSLLTLLDLSAAFDTIDHSILLSRLHDSFGISSVVLNWFKSYLSGRTQTVSVNGILSSPTSLDCGVPQGSVLGPVLFSLYVTPLVDIIRRHNTYHHCYADDTQLYNSDTPENINSVVKITSDCFLDIQSWMTMNKLQLNGTKTEAMLVGTHHKLSKTNLETCRLGDISIPLATSVKNLGVSLDNSLSMQSFVSSTTQSCYFHLYRISSIRKFLTVEATTKLVVCLILSRLDYCNSLLFGLPFSTIQPLQRVQNSAARLILKKKKSDHISPILSSLHWLPVSQRIEFKFLVLVFKVVRNLAPSYLTDLLSQYLPSRSLRSSSDSSLLTIPRPLRLKSIDSRAFSVAGPTLWNHLPSTLRHAKSLSSFKSHLKTHLFPYKQ